VVGRLDRPSEQRTEPFALDLAGAGGHLVVVGSPRTGKSTLLRTLAASLIWRHTPAQVQLYGIDLGGGLLGALAGAPHVGGIAGKLDREAVTRVVRQLRTEVEDREQAFRQAGHESMTDARNAGSFPDVFLFVDGWEAFKREFEMLDREVEELAANGLSFGIHVVVAANRWAEIRPALLDNLGTRLELRLHDAIDSLVSRQAAASLPAEVPGRGLTVDALHFQAALPRVDGRAEEEGTATALGELVADAAEHWSGAPAPPIRLLPRELDPRQLPPPSPREGVPFGVEERGLDPVWVRLGDADPHFLVFGDSQSGKSSLLRGLGRGLIATHSPEQLQLMVVDVRRSLIDLAHDPHVMAYAASPPAAQEAAERLRAIAGERMAPADASPLAGPSWQGPRYVILFDDYDLVAGPTGGPLAPLLDVLAVGGDVGMHVVLARRVGGSARGAYEAVFGRLRELGSPGVLLSGDPGEGPLLGGTKAQPQPPGRGLFVRRGERPVLVQSAFSPPTPVPGTAAVRAGGTDYGRSIS
jgi:S-DNA-T family DNA segregation ATPase FtsK/SpoIIIE